MDTDISEGIQKMSRRVRVHSFQCKDLKIFRKDSTQSQPSTKYGSSADGSGSRKNEINKPNYSEIMLDRWQNTNSNLPTHDKEDIKEENPLCNGGAKPSPTRQAHPEFIQTSYLRIRSLEEAYQMSDYFEPYA